MAIAYLNSEYPSLSHTFIQREIAEVRRLGVEVRTFSVRKPTATGTLGEAHEHEGAQTGYILGSTLGVIRALIVGVLGHPIGAIRALIAGQRLSTPGLRARIWHVAYAIEAIRLSRMLAADGLRHIHVHMANNAASIALLATRFDRRLSYSLSIHGSAEFFHVDDWRLRPKSENAVFVRCISHFCRAQVMSATDPDAWERFHIVPCGVDTARFSPTSNSPDAGGDAALRLLTIGRMHSIKGYGVLLEACAALCERGIGVRLVMVGDGPMLGELRARAVSRGIDRRVEFAGPVAQEDLGGYLDQADAMVVSSFMEGVPVVLMEAMGCGLAVIATRVGGIPELVEDGVSGLLVDPGSVGSLVEAIEQLAGDANRRLSMGRAGRGAVVSRYDIAQTGRGMVELFREYIGCGASDNTVECDPVVASTGESSACVLSDAR